MTSEGGSLSLGERVKKDFEVLGREVNGHSLVYLDNAATSQKPSAMLQAMHDFYHQYNRPEEVVFTRNATEGINIVAQAWGAKNLKPGDEIIMSVAEHHSNLAPWQLVARRTGAVIREVRLTPDTQELDLQHLESLLNDRTRVVAVVHVSNTLGCITDMAQVASLAHKMVLQWRALCMYELLDAMPPFMVGGETTGDIHLEDFQPAPPPLKFEAGTPAIAEAIGYGAAIDYLTYIGMNNMHKYESELGTQMYRGLSSIPGIRIFGPPPTVPQGRAAVVSFVIEGVNLEKLEALLNKQGIAVSSGMHRCKPLHEYLGIGPTMRASCYFYNTANDIQLFLTKLKEAIPQARPIAEKVKEGVQQVGEAIKSAVEL
ncbi:hypothetical protein N2152v2_009000 [Parachlorella kessleri]